MGAAARLISRDSAPIFASPHRTCLLQHGQYTEWPIWFTLAFILLVVISVKKRSASLNPKTGIDIDFATAGDLPQLADLLAELFTLESDFKPERDRQLRGLKLILDNPSLGRLFVLRVDGQVAGMANALITVSTAEGGRVLLLEDVIVSSEHRGGGLGRRLVEHALGWAKEQGMTRVTLLADRDNHAALDFYRALGFETSHMQVLRKKT